MAGSGTGTKAIGTSSAGGLVVAPAVEPISLQDLKNHLRLDSGGFADNLTTIQSIAPGSHAITVGYTLLGAYADVLGLSAVVILDSGTNGATGTVDAKIQESDDHVAWIDWTGGTFTQITEANDNAIYEKAYTGSKQYIRVVAKISLAACEFGIQIAKYSSDVTEDALLTTLIISARQYVEVLTRRQLITATYDAFLDEFPAKDFIKLPFGNLQSVTSVKYKNSAGTETTMVVTTDYLTDISSEPGRIVLPYGVSWPSFTAYTVNPITVRFVCGYGLAADVPNGIKTAIKMIAAGLYENRETQVVGQTLVENKAAVNLLAPFKIWSF